MEGAIKYWQSSDTDKNIKILYLLPNNEWWIKMISSSTAKGIYYFTMQEIIILSGALVPAFF